MSDGKFWDHESLLYEHDTLDSIWHWIVIPCYYDNININTNREKKLWEMIRWSPEGKFFDLLRISLDLFIRELMGGQFREFAFRSWSLKGWKGCLFKSSNWKKINRAVYTRKNKMRLKYDANCTIYTSMSYPRREQLV